MSTLAEYYEQQLYPLQDKVLKILDSLETKFYLTGGTAISRAYFNHRYSDDLDFFLNHDPDFEQQTQFVFDQLRKRVEKIEVTMSYDTFARCFVSEDEVVLKVEFVNDVPYHVGNFERTKIFAKTDNIGNILSNKICALARNAPKDVADIWQIARSYVFNWAEAIENAKAKDMWVDESKVMMMIAEFDVISLHEVKWVKPFEVDQAKKDIAVIVEDIFFGQNNSLFIQTKL
jgi:predicted nucleotidyltransferase component of viral defense system